MEKENLIHLEGDRYLIKVSSLKIAEFAAEEKEDFVFSNPRHFKPGMPGVAGEGFDRDSMRELREAIKQRGLLEPLCARNSPEEDEEYQIVAGERRFRSCTRLAEDDEQCYDPRTKEMKSGAELYEYVECHLFDDLSDKDAMNIAFIENSTAVGIGESANFNLFRYWRSHGFTDQEIMDMTKKTVAWIHHMDVISALDEDTLKAYCNNEINQTVALQLANIENVQERVEILKTTCEFARDRAKIAIEKADKELNVAVKASDEAKNKVVMAEDEEAVEKAEEVQMAADKKVQTKLRIVQKANNNARQAKTRDMVSAAQKVTGKKPKDTNTCLRGPTIQKYILDPLDEIIKNDGNDEDGFIASVDVLKVARLVASEISDGNRNLIAALKDNFGEEEFEVNDDLLAEYDADDDGGKDFYDE